MSNSGKTKPSKISYEQSVIKQMEESRVRIRPWVLKSFGVVFILIGLILVVSPFINQQDTRFSLRTISDKISELISNNEDQEKVAQEDGKEEEEQEKDTVGRIADGTSTKRDDSTTGIAMSKSVQNSTKIKTTGIWTATNYSKGDISKGTYEVKLGDTLWEISEAVYGSGLEWNRILEDNKNSIGFLPDGTQANLSVGQLLMIN